MRGFICFISLLLFSLVNCGNVVKQISPKDFPLHLQPSRQVQGRIVNGNAAARTQFPYLVSIRASSGSTVSICGGSILSSTYILTAAHCTKGYKTFEIGFGSSILNVPIMKRTAVTKMEHPEFNPDSLNNDIALIKLPLPVPLGLSIKAIELPQKAQALSSFIDYLGIVSGFGRTSDNSTVVSPTLNYVSMRVISNLECSNVFGSKIVTNNVICARGSDGTNRNACLGDSGGPLVIDDDKGVFTQIGIVSFVSSRGCTYGDPSGYTRVGPYVDWISQITRIPIRT